MSRYIDRDALKYYGNHIGDEYEDRFHDAQWVYRSDIDSAPSIDIVRCGECKWNDGKGHCKLRYGSLGVFEDVRTDDFCSYGEREGE